MTRLSTCFSGGLGSDSEQAVDPFVNEAGEAIEKLPVDPPFAAIA
jgi:hypothetical protein